MKIFCLLSWYDEKPEHLHRCVRSLQGFADTLIAVDGAYSTFPGAQAESPRIQQNTLSEIARATMARPFLVTPSEPWVSEVEKRAAMFEYARQAGATTDDWLLIIDGDMALGHFTREARDKIAASDRDVAEVQWRDVQINGVMVNKARFRSMFRALPDLTVERTHFLYTAMCIRCAEETAPRQCVDCKGTGRRFLWLLPNGHPSDEPILDLFGDVTLHHYNSSRDPERSRRARAYYADRDTRGLEAVGDWR